MNKVKHRKELLDRIMLIEDKDVLDEIYRLLQVNFDDSIFQLNEIQKKEIDQARQEIKRGEGIPSERLNKDIDEWLKE